MTPDQRQNIDNLIINAIKSADLALDSPIASHLAQGQLLFTQVQFLQAIALMLRELVDTPKPTQPYWPPPKVKS